MFEKKPYSSGVFKNTWYLTTAVNELNIWKGVRKSLLGVLKVRDQDSQVELGTLSDGTEHERFSNAGRAYTMASRYPGTWRYCMSIWFLVFKNLNCLWIGYISHCYIVRSTGLNNIFGLFDSTQVLPVVNNNEWWLEDQNEFEKSGAIRNERDAIAQQCFDDADEGKCAELTNELVWWSMKVLSN